MNANEKPTYEDLAERVSEASDNLYTLAKQLENYWKEHAIPGEKPMRVLYIAKETLQNMCYTLETIADEMLGN